MTTALLSLAVVSCVLLSGCDSATDAKKEIPPGDGESGSGRSGGDERQAYDRGMARLTTYTDLRAHLKDYCDAVAESGEPLVIQRRNGAHVALVSLEELAGLEETAHLLRSSENARRLFESIAETWSGGGVALTVEELRQSFGLDE
jgi:antitoxin YefM